MSYCAWFLLTPALVLGATLPLRAEIALEGFFIAERACPATQSIRTGANPGGVMTEPRRAYDLLAGNRETPSHFLVRVPGVQPERRWVAVECGLRAVAVDTAPPGDTPRPGRIEHVLAASWQPAFCETRPQKVECASQTEDRFDADSFSLHGLWPQPFSNIYCDVPAELEAKDRAGRWDALPEVALAPETRAELNTVMPGAASLLDRHEWIKHGTCYEGSMQDYFAHSLVVMRGLNGSAVRDLFAENIDQTLTSSRIRAAFDAAFGAGAGDRVRVSCVTDPSNGRRLIGELTIALSGSIDEDTGLGDLILAAPPTAQAGCPEGIVDRAGFQ